MTATVQFKDRGEAAAARATYRRLIVESRKRQLTQTRDNINRLAQTYDAAARRIAGQFIDIPGFMLDERNVLRQIFLRQQLEDLDRTVQAMVTDYSAVLDLSLRDLAQAAAEREDAMQQLMASSAARDYRLAATLERSYILSSGDKLGVKFGRVAQSAVERLAGRYYRDGLTLSERIHGQILAPARRQIEDAVTQAVAEGAPAKELGRQLESLLTAKNTENARYNAMRIARTEINNAYREAHIQSAQQPDGTLKPFLSGIRWNLSLSHPAPDICDAWASHDSGLGQGVYLPGAVPVDHPHGLCYTVSVLKNYPDISAPAKAPDAGAVPESQIAYYAGQGDAVAQATQAAAA